MVSKHPVIIQGGMGAGVSSWRLAWAVSQLSLWMEKRNADRYEREVFPKVEEILKPYLTTPITFKAYNLETTLCEHFVQALAA